MNRPLPALFLVCTLVGCGADVLSGPDGGSSGTLPDSGAGGGAPNEILDSGTDGSEDAGADTLPEAGVDGGQTDAGSSAKPDAGSGAKPDAGSTAPPPACVTPACKCGTNCLVPSNWDHAWRVGKNGYATPYVRDLGEEISKKMYPPISDWNQMLHGYLSPSYGYFSEPNTSVTPPMYRRHLGWDMGRPHKTPVRSLTKGRVTFRQIKDEGFNSILIIREEKDGKFQDRWWVYGHISPAAGIAVGDDIAEGQLIGTVWEIGGGPHIHLTVFSVNWQAEILDPDPPLEWRQHWGRTQGVTSEIADSIARQFTVHPLHAYALYKGYDVTP